MSKHVVFINGRFLTQSVTGVQRYADELIKQIDHMLDHGEISRELYSFIILTPKNQRRTIELKHIELRQVGFLTGHLWEQLELPLFTRGSLLLNLCNVGPLLKRNQFVTIHDAAVFAAPKGFTLLFRTWYKFLLVTNGRLCKKVLTVSQFSKHELVKYCKINPAKIIVTPLGREHVYRAVADRTIFERKNIGLRPYVLAVCSTNPNKNFKSVIEAFRGVEELSFDLVIAGDINRKVFAGEIDDLLSNPHIIHCGYVTDDELRALYEQAMCFIFPSIYEGFGIPPLEAMSYGCPVIASRKASIPEVCADAVLYIDHEHSQDIVDKIQLLLDNPSERSRLSEKGKRRAMQYSWFHTAKLTSNLINEVFDRKEVQHAMDN